MVRAAGIALVLLALACGSRLEDPVSNAEGCKQLSKALRAACPDMRWLNCDELPGCPGGEVEKQDVDACERRIEIAGSCEDARAVGCTFRRLSCQDPAGEVGIPSETRGYYEVCQVITALLNYNGCSFTKDASICSELLECSGGAFNFTDVEVLLDEGKLKAKADGASTCEQWALALRAEFDPGSIRHKYCLPPDEAE